MSNFSHTFFTHNVLVHRLARYYKSTRKIAPTFKYDSQTASTLVA